MDFIFTLKDGTHCENCRHGVARMQIKDAMRLLDIGRGGEDEGRAESRD